MITESRNEKLKLLAILLLIFHLTLSYTYAQDNWTEKDWINYAKAQGNSYEFTLKSLKNIMADKEYEDYLDSMARTDVFSPLVYNGIELRKSDIKPPVLTGIVSYYFLDGKLASQMEFVNGVANGKCIYNYPNGNIYQKEVYKNGETNARDTIKEFSTKGQLVATEIETDSCYAIRGYSYEEGKLLMEFFDYKTGYLEDTVSEKYFDMETKTEKTRVYKDTKTLENFYDYNGKKISMAKFYLIAMNEEKNHPFESWRAFPKRKSETLERSDNELLNSYSKNLKKVKKHFEFNWETHENFTSCNNGKVLKRIDNAFGYNSNKSDYPHSEFLDTLFCEPGKQAMRTAQTKNGKLHGELKYYYPSGQLLALLNFKEDYPDGNFIIYNADGTVKKRSNYKMGIEIDSTIEFTNNNILKTLTVWEDSVKYIRNTFWEDGKILQQSEQCAGEIIAVKKQYGSMRVASKKIIETRYYNKQGEEISKKQFSKQYPSILEEYDPRKMRAKF